MGDNSFRQCELVHTARPLFVRSGAYGDVVPAHSVGSPPPCGEGLGVGVVAVARGTCLTTTPTRLASLATLPTRGRVRTEFAARGDGNSRDDVPALRRHAPRSPGGPEPREQNRRRRDLAVRLPWREPNLPLCSSPATARGE